MRVCPECDGTGIEPGTGITFTSADLDEAYGDDYYERQEGARAWANYGQVCKLCHGHNVISDSRYDQWETDYDSPEAQEMRECEAMSRMERMMGC